jgi:hypothetical protein
MRPPIVVAVSVLALLPAAAVAASPIPQSDTDTPFIGTPATPDPISSPDPPRHPHMAPNGRSNLHDDAYQTDAYQGPGPLGNKPSVVSTFYANDCGSVTFDAKGRIVTICVGLAGPTLRMLDAKTLDELASFSLPGRGLPNPSHPSPFNDFGGGGYFYLDDADQAVLPTTNGHIYVVGETSPGPGFELKKDYDLTGSIATGDKIFSALPDWGGRIWFASTKGIVGFVDPATGKVASMDTGEEVANSFAIDELGGVYLVTDKALYRFDAGADGKPHVTWKQVYPNSGIAKPGQVDAGSGTTPTITPRGFVAITDNADPMDVVLYDRVDGHEVCRVPVFDKGASDSDNSLVSFGDALIVENNYGYNGPQATEQGKTTTPGIWRVDYDPQTGGCNVVWKSSEISPTVVPKVSLANGLLYAWTKPTGDDKDPWYLTAIDARTGKTIYKQLGGTGLGFNNNYAPITLGPDGTAYTGVLGGLVAIRDATPPPGATSTAGTAAAGCGALPAPGAAAHGSRLTVAPRGVADVTLARWTFSHGRAKPRRVRRFKHVSGTRTIAAKGLPAGTYVVGFRSGADVRTRVVRLRRHRWARSPLNTGLAASCARATLSGPLFDRRGLRVTVAPTDPKAQVQIVARRAGRRRGKPVKPSRVVSTSLVRALLALGPGTWHVTVTVGGHRVGTMTATRPR